jgi:hypothetical protein
MVGADDREIADSTQVTFSQGTYWAKLTLHKSRKLTVMDTIYYLIPEISSLSPSAAAIVAQHAGMRTVPLLAICSRENEKAFSYWRPEGS